MSPLLQTEGDEDLETHRFQVPWFRLNPTECRRIGASQMVPPPELHELVCMNLRLVEPLAAGPERGQGSTSIIIIM